MTELQKLENLKDYIEDKINELVKLSITKEYYGGSPKRVRFINPLGQIFETNNLTHLANKYRLHQASLSKLISGTNLTHKGWRLYKNQE